MWNVRSTACSRLARHDAPADANAVVSRQILFVSHQASRTGAPIVLLEILRWMRAHTDCRCSVLFWSGGSLLPEFRDLAQCRVLHPTPSAELSIGQQLWERLSLRPDDSTRERGRLERTVRGTAQMLASAADERWMRAWRSCDLVYANSVGSARAMRALGPNAPLLAHVHESSYSLHHTESRADVAAVVGGTHPIIAASRAVASTLTDDFTVSPSRIHVMNSFITLPPPDVPGEVVDSLRESLGIPANAFVVGGMGTIEWRKGADTSSNSPGDSRHCVRTVPSTSYGPAQAPPPIHSNGSASISTRPSLAQPTGSTLRARSQTRGRSTTYAMRSR